MLATKTLRILVMAAIATIRTIKEETGPVAWIQFDDAVLNLEGFYQYPKVRMTPPEQLCDWEY